MSALIPFLALNQTGDQVLAWVNQQLARAGFRVAQTFDLQVARLAHADCPCPHHGTDRCTCQMIVLLIYGEHADPATLVIHGQDGGSWLSFANPAAQHAHQRLEAFIRRALNPDRAEAPSPIKVLMEVEQRAGSARRKSFHLQRCTRSRKRKDK